MLATAKLARSTYYAVLKVLAKPNKYAAVRNEIKNICSQNFVRYGYSHVTLELHKLGYTSNHKVVMKLMKEEKLTCKVRMKKYRSYRGECGKVAPNIINRNFRTNSPNHKWTTDITEFHLFGRKLYLSPVLDMYNGEIISYELSERPALEQVIRMLQLAIDKTVHVSGIVLHSDQGWQYQHKHYQQILKDHGIIQSMSRKGNCLDNSVMENFFGLLKSELLYLREFNSYEEFVEEIHKYIHYYNNNRIKAKLKGMSPVEYREHSQLVA